MGVSKNLEQSTNRLLSVSFVEILCQGVALGRKKIENLNFNQHCSVSSEVYLASEAPQHCVGPVWTK